jgi:hypothetical protein
MANLKIFCCKSGSGGAEPSIPNMILANDLSFALSALIVAELVSNNFGLDTIEAWELA